MVTIAREGAEMKRVNANVFFLIGSAVHPLTEIGRDVSVAQYLLPLLHSRGWMRSLLSNSVVPLRVSRQACQELLDRISAVLPEPAKPEDYNKQLTPYDSYRISDAAKSFETVLGAELQTHDTYFVDQKGAYSTSDLIERADVMLPPDIRAKLSEVALNDLRQAGRAFVFELFTAAGFHLMRAAESVIRMYYESVVGTKPKPKQRDWGVYIKGLEKRGADAKVLGAINQMRELHRNPLIHPEEVLSETEAQMLFGIAQSAIAAIVSDIESRKAAATVAATP